MLLHKKISYLAENKDNILPLQVSKYKVYIKNIDKGIASKYAVIVDDPKEADFAVVQINTPWVPIESKSFARASTTAIWILKGKIKKKFCLSVILFNYFKCIYRSPCCDH
ncbi:MAG: hypothetical protein IPJ13_32190 [Saprospiraceae bacterium]|nr:hypothetical protein [Saprospiraceae bacterium]